MDFKTIIIHHGGCPDGSAAALAAYESSFGVRADYRPYGYQDAAPTNDEIEGKDVYVLDFSFPRDDIERMAKIANKLVVIDHHKTAEDRLKDHPNCIFDMEHSGAVLAWSHFNELPPSEVPEFYKYIEDRDLWRFNLPYSKEISAALNSYNGRRDFVNWIPILQNWEERKPELIKEGAAILRYEKALIRSMVPKAEIVTLQPSGVKAMVVNSCVLFSDAAEELCFKSLKENVAEIGIVYFWDGKTAKWVFSVRSRNEFDVAALAQSYGGGGHKSAAGFTLPEVPWDRKLAQRVNLRTFS